MNIVSVIATQLHFAKPLPLKTIIVLITSDYVIILYTPIPSIDLNMYNLTSDCVCKFKVYTPRPLLSVAGRLTLIYLLL